MLRNERTIQLTPSVTDRDHIQGPDDAPLTLVLYGDYECPYTRKSLPAVHALQQQHGDQLRFVFRNFPLTEIHPHALQAAEAAEAAAAQGRFWEMHAYLFAHLLHQRRPAHRLVGAGLACSCPPAGHRPKQNLIKYIGGFP